MKAVAAVVVVAREGGLRKDAKRLLLLAPGPGFLAALHISRLFEKVFTVNVKSRLTVLVDLRVEFSTRVSPTAGTGSPALRHFFPISLAFIT